MPLRFASPGAFVCLFLLASPGALQGQAPEGWNHREVLGADLKPSPDDWYPPDDTWFGAGLWGAAQHGVPATLIDSLGMGNGYVGQGVSAQAGINLGYWSFAVLGMADTDRQGRSHFTVMQSHALLRTQGGWTIGYEQEPLVWGYGLNGGYLLGEAARPFPKMRVASPLGRRTLFGCSMGEWAWQAFLGKLENGRELPENSQMPLGQQSTINALGDPQSPMFSGYRVEADFFERRLETYANLTVLWGGTVGGVPMTQGYGLGDYLTAMTGAKDPLAESGINWSDPNHPQPQYVNKARSSGNFDLGLRVHFPELASLMAADKAWFYLSRGSKGMTVNWKQAYHQPVWALGQDVSNDSRSAIKLNFAQLWTQSDRYYLPNELVPNDTFGLLIQWTRVRLGLEYQNTVNPLNYYRSFANTTYPTGFYTYGDPLGEAMGGEAQTKTIRLETDLSRRLTATTWALIGSRPFRDDLTLWNAAHPGDTPITSHFWGLQHALTWKANANTTLGMRASWQHQTAYLNVPGQDGNGFRWTADLSFRWPGIRGQ